MDVTACHSAEPAVAEMASFSESLERRTRGWAGAWELEEGRVWLHPPGQTGPGRPRPGPQPWLTQAGRPPARLAGVWRLSRAWTTAAKSWHGRRVGSSGESGVREARSGWGQPGRGVMEGVGFLFLRANEGFSKANVAWLFFLPFPSLD